MLEDAFLLRFLRIFQHGADEVFDQIDTLPYQFDARTAPLPMVRQLGRWIGLDVDPVMSQQLQRDIVIHGAATLPWRGTKRGLTHMLEVLTGGDVTVEDSGGVYAEGEDLPRRPPHVKVTVTRAHRLRMHRAADDLAQYIRQELPAAVTFELEVNGTPVWPRAALPPRAARMEGVA
jgi:phage tail-like protein